MLTGDRGRRGQMSDITASLERDRELDRSGRNGGDASYGNRHEAEATAPRRSGAVTAAGAIFLLLGLAQDVGAVVSLTSAGGLGRGIGLFVTSAIFAVTGITVILRLT